MCDPKLMLIEDRNEWFLSNLATFNNKRNQDIKICTRHRKSLRPPLFHFYPKEYEISLLLK